MDLNKPLISTIIPTIAVREKEELLKRAIYSVRKSFTGTIRIIVVVNGSRFDANVCEWLKAQPDILFDYLATPSLPHAIIRGRELVDTPYFSTLDDDDEYLPLAMNVKLAALEADFCADLVVTDGYRHQGGRDVQIYKNISCVSSTPLKCLFDANWLNSANALYRTDSIGLTYFTNYVRLREWTWLAFSIATNEKKIIALDTPTFRIHDTPHSLSKSDDYFEASLEVYERMLEKDLPTEITSIIKRRMAAELHDQSSQALKFGKRMRSWKYHLKSLTLPGGLRYLAYSRKLIPFWPTDE